MAAGPGGAAADGQGPGPARRAAGARAAVTRPLLAVGGFFSEARPRTLRKPFSSSVPAAPPSGGARRWLRAKHRGAKDLKLDLFETGRKRPKTTGMSRAGVQNVVGLLYGVSGGHLGDRCFETCCAPRKMRAQQANAAKMRQKCVLCFTFTTFTCPQPHNTAPQPACPELGANASTSQVSHEGRTARTRRQHCPKPPQSLSFSHMMT